jgi:quercetin dioxygenase-like cupin family protein
LPVICEDIITRGLIEMDSWIEKDGYDTCLLASADELNAEATEIQQFRFRKGKFDHYHKAKTEFFYFTAGIGKVFLNGREQELRPGTTLVVQPGVRHMFVNESDDQMLEGIMVKTNNDPSDTYRDDENAG